MKGKKVIVRANEAGVFFGTLKEKNEKSVIMTDVRKIHYWEGAAAVEQIAADGIKKSESSRLTVVVSEMEIENPVQIIPCTEGAIANLEAIKEWKR